MSAERWQLDPGGSGGQLQWIHIALLLSGDFENKGLIVIGTFSCNGALISWTRCLMQQVTSFQIVSSETFIFSNALKIKRLILPTTARGLQRDVVYLGWPFYWPITPSYMSPNEGRGGAAGSQPMSTYSLHSSPYRLWRSNSIYNL